MIRREFGIAVDIQRGGLGQYDVFLGDKLVASRRAEGEMAKLLGSDGFPDTRLTLLALRDALADQVT